VSRLLAVLLLALALTVSCGGEKGAERTPGAPDTAAPAAAASATAIARRDYQATYKYEVKKSELVGAMIYAQQWPLRASWLELNGYTTGWVYDGKTMTSCTGDRRSGGECFAEPVPDGAPTAGRTYSQEELEELTRQAQAKLLPGRTIAGLAATCYEVGNDAHPATMCTAEGGIMLLTETAEVRVEASIVGFTVDSAVFTLPFPLKVR
jgi:hypothetical protein